MDWIETLPAACPPMDAVVPSNIAYYRIMHAKCPEDRDFLSVSALYPNRKLHVSECQAKSLSVFTDLGECEQVKKLAAFKEGRIGKLDLTEKDGLTVSTPNEGHKSHVSWWRSVDFQISHCCPI